MEPPFTFITFFFFVEKFSILMNFNFFLLWIFLLILCLKVQPSPCPPVVFSVLSSGFHFPLDLWLCLEEELGLGHCPLFPHSDVPCGCFDVPNCLLTRLPSVYRTTFIPLPETRWLWGGGGERYSISVLCIILNEFLVSFSENGI